GQVQGEVKEVDDVDEIQLGIYAFRDVYIQIGSAGS
ncbi:MAG: hypothetical protein EZS28_035789, partial [Streblomastix strix]